MKKLVEWIKLNIEYYKYHYIYRVLQYQYGAPEFSRAKPIPRSMAPRCPRCFGPMGKCDHDPFEKERVR